MTHLTDALAWLIEKARGDTGYPLAMIAYYGPNEQMATKAVLGMVNSAAEQQASAIQRLFATRQDARQDAEITQKILTYIQEHGARRVVMAEKIMGCPHEAGVDYPEGETCPQCDYWAGHLAPFEEDGH